MSKSRDIEIKLFGKIITSVNHYNPSSFSDQNKKASSSSSSSSSSEISSPRSSNSNEDQHSEITTSTSATTLKKPDKSLLPCPRCESLNTKFCYFNNYNVNQPRYLCRNCQRYWTSGGSMRNILIGSGRRKNKEDFEEHKTHQRLLLPQVIFQNVSSPWPNATFYPIPLYLGCTVPIWPTSETSPCLGKRSRDKTEGANDDTTRSRLVSEPMNQATKRTVWSTLPTKSKTKTVGFSLFNGFERSSNRRSLVPETYLSLQVNPAAMSRSMNFRESMATIIKH